MNKIGVHEVGERNKTLSDGFNYPTLNRNMLMSMNTITKNQDFVKTTTSYFNSNRRSSNNLSVTDIEGKSNRQNLTILQELHRKFLVINPTPNLTIQTRISTLTVHRQGLTSLK